MGIIQRLSYTWHAPFLQRGKLGKPHTQGVFHIKMTHAHEIDDLTIRPATDADMPALSRVAENEADYFEQCFARQAQGERLVLAAFLGAEIAGYVIFNRKPRYALYRKLNMPEIQDLNVVQSARRRGIGAALVASCEDLARAEQYQDVGISVGLHGGFGAAQRLYVRMGYIPDGFGITYDRETVRAGDIRAIDDDLCLMMVKTL